MMSLTIRKTIVSGTIGIIFITANIIAANWISDTGIADKTGSVRREFLTRTAIYIAAEIPGLAAFVFPCIDKSHKILQCFSHEHLMAICL